MLELYVLICIIIVSVILLIYYSEEPFVNSTEEPSFYLQSCPNGYTSFTDSDGSSLCCSGSIVAGACNGEKQCTLTGSGAIPNCTTLLQEEYTKKADQCPASMASYYENSTTKKKGCTAGKLNKTMDGPASASQAVCTIYSDLIDSMNSLDSCAIHKEMDAFPCFGTTCTKTVTQNKPGTPVLITISFTDTNGIQHISHTRASMKRFLDATQPNWKEKGMDLDKNVSIAEVAKAYYIDRTMQQGDIQV